MGRRRSVCLIALVAALAAAIGPSPAADEPASGAYLRVTGLRQASGAIFAAVDAFAHGVTVGVDPAGRSVSKPAFSAFEIERDTDRWTPMLVEHLTTGAPIEEIVFRLRRGTAAGDQPVLYQVTLRDCLIESFEQSGSGDGIVESWSIRYAAIGVHVLEDPATGVYAGFGYDLATGSSAGVGTAPGAVPPPPVRRLVLFVDPPPTDPVEVLLERAGVVVDQQTLDAQGGAAFDALPPDVDHLLEFLVVPVVAQ